MICGSHERRLLNDLLSNYNVLERPVANESEVLIVYFSLTLQQIIDVDEKNQNIITNMWLRLVCFISSNHFVRSIFFFSTYFIILFQRNGMIRIFDGHPMIMVVLPIFESHPIKYGVRIY